MGHISFGRIYGSQPSIFEILDNCMERKVRPKTNLKIFSSKISSEPHLETTLYEYSNFST